MKKIRIAALAAVILAAVMCLSACSTLKDIMSLLESIAEALPTDGPEGGTGTPDAVETDENGHVIKLSHFDGDGKLVFVHVQTWENDRISNKKSYDSKGQLTGSVDYEYDAHGNCTRMAWFFWNSGNLMRVERKYDEYDRLIEDTGYGTETVSTNKTFFEYDDSDGNHPTNYCKKTYYPRWTGSEDDRYYVSTLDYDADGRLIKITTVDQTGALSHYDVYTYADGKLQQTTNYDPDGKPNYTYKYYYDEDGKRIREERYNADGELEGVDY